MKRFLYLLVWLPALLCAQSQDPCHSINDYNAQLKVLNPKATVDLPEGWSMFGYSCTDSIYAIDAFEQIADKIEIVKDEWGLSYLPDWDFNALGSLKFSEGYQIKLNEEVTGFSFCEGVVLPSLEGCSDCEALNFNPWATKDNGTCNYDTDGDGVYDADEVEGCVDSAACNYNSEATDEGPCTYSEVYLDCSGSCLNDTDSDGVCDEIEVLGCTDQEACNYNAGATEENNSCTHPLENYLDCSGACLSDADSDGVCDEIEVGGCTDESSCNYNSEATDDDGSCVSVGDESCVIYEITFGDRVEGSTANAENNFGGESPEHIYKFQVTVANNYVISTCGSDFDTYIRVYDENMTELYSADDDGDCGNKAILMQSLDIGVYYVLVEGYQDYQGNYVLSIKENITCGATVTGSTENAESNYGYSSPEHIYKFDVVSSGTYVFSTCGSAFDTYMRIYDEDMTELYYGDDDGDCGSSVVLEKTLEVGTYFILIEGYSALSGDYTFTVSCP